MKDILAGTIATAAGTLALLIALGFTAERVWFLSNAQSAAGTVVALQKNRWSNSTRAGYFPVVEFSTRDGHTFRAEGSSSRPPRYVVGERVNVYFDPSSPDNARLDDFVGLWLTSVISGGVGTVLFPLGVVLLVIGIRHRQRQTLRTRGIAVTATVTHADTSSVQRWGKTVQHLTLEGIDPRTGERRSFRSHPVPGQGDQWLGRQVVVFVDPTNAKRYLVDAPTP
jgi:hypothetical protein